MTTTEQLKEMTIEEVFAKCVQTLADDYEKTIWEDYRTWDIESWSEMVMAFGQTAKEMKDDVIYTLGHEEHLISEWYVEESPTYLCVHYHDETINYRKLMNAVRKELKAREVFTK